jgi:Enoyl-(Acyl carrier protein) reductase/Enolase C-terminal domain-like/Mandelate racemase / muconate lactonizing enzyme, N-terminal domain
LAGYCATKGGVRLFAKAVAMECAAEADGIRVNTVHPGVIDTPIWTKLPVSAGRDVPIDPDEVAKAGVPLGRAGQAQDIANGFLFLASDASSYMTAAELVIDGGITGGARAGRKSLHFVGYEGMSMIAVTGVDMAAWDALAKAAGVPLCVLLGGSVGAAPAYKSNGLWLRSPNEVASEAVELREEGGFQGLKLRLGREHLADDLATIEAVRDAVGSEMSLMVDFNQGLHFGEALERCRAIDDLGLAWIEEPVVYDNL